MKNHWLDEAKYKKMFKVNCPNLFIQGVTMKNHWLDTTPMGWFIWWTTEKYPEQKHYGYEYDGSGTVLLEEDGDKGIWSEELHGEELIVAKVQQLKRLGKWGEKVKDCGYCRAYRGKHEESLVG